MPYAEEEVLGIEGWTPDRFGDYDFSYADEILTNRLAFDKFENADEELGALHRLAQVGSKSGSVPARSALAQYGGIGLDEARLFTGAVNHKTDNIDPDVLHEVLIRARIHKLRGNYSGYLALSGSVGIYPPESGDNIRWLVHDYDDLFYKMRQEFAEGNCQEALELAVRAGLNPESFIDDGK